MSEIKGKRTMTDKSDSLSIMKEYLSTKYNKGKIRLLRLAVIIVLIASALVCGLVSDSAAVATDFGKNTVLATDTTVNWARAMGGTSPNVDNMILKSISIYVGNTHSSQVRLAVYSGGNLSTGPDGATLVCDGGVTSGTGTGQFLTVNCSDEAIAKNTPVWVAIAGNDSAFSVRYSTSSGDAGDFQTANGRFVSGGQVSSDEATAFPSTWPSDTGTFAAFWYSVYLTYDTTGGGGGGSSGDWGRTVANGTNTNVNFTRVMGGTSPSVDGMILKSVSVYVGNAHSSQARVAVYQGGNLNAGPDGATLLCDAGTTTGTATNQFLTLTCSDTLIHKNTPLWVAVKGNDAGFAIQYSSSNANAGDFQTTNGRFQSGGQVSTNEATAYPSTWPSDSGTFSNYWYSYYISYEVPASCTDPDASTITIPASQSVKGDPFDASGMFSPTGDVDTFEYKLSTAGSADVLDWGKTDMGRSVTNVNWTRVSNGNAPSSAGMNLKSVSIYVGANHADQVRLAVYSGGSLTSGPTGATLLYDFGITTGSAVNQWLTLTYSGANIVVPADQPVWIAFKGNSGGAGFDVNYGTSAVGSDFQTARGRWYSTSVSNDDAVAYPSTWPADSSGSFSNYWYSTYITYEAGGETVCTPWTTNSVIPASIFTGSKCGDYDDGGTYYLDVRGTDPDCGDIITTTEEAFTWNQCLANTTDDLSEVFLESYEVSMTWSFECTNNEYYKIYRNGSFLANVSPCRGTYTDATVLADTDYSYTVRGYSTNEPCESGDSNTINIHTPVYEPRTTPGIAAASPADQSIYITARYTNDSDKDNTLLVEWGLDQVDFSLGSVVLANGQSPYMDQITSLTNGTAYQIRITYQDSDGFTGGDPIQIINHVVPAIWSDDTMLHNGLRFPANKYWGGDWGTPAGEYGGFTCETCHEMSTSNIKRVKESITAPAGGFPGAEVVFTETDGAGFGDDTAPKTSSQKICEVCHSKTLYHRFNSPTARRHESEPAMYDCTLCHPHEEGFKPAGACTICHAIAMGDRVAVTGQFNSTSHHIQGVDVNETHCYECHWEANSDGSVNTTYHGGSLAPGATVNLVMYGSGVRPTNYALGMTAVEYNADGSRTQIMEMNQHCISCHNTENNSTEPFGDGNTPNEYAWDGTCSNTTYNYKRELCLSNGGTWTKGTSINERYAPETTTQWGKYSVANTNGKDVMTKAHSSHGVAQKNEQGYDLADGWPDTSGYINVACFDCHNSHGSDVAGTTTSYTSDAEKGGNLKSTIAGKGGYAMTYQPAAGGSAGNNNIYNSGAALCFDCHETVEAGTAPWGYEGTYGATMPIRGYNDTAYFGSGFTGPQQRYTYKQGAGSNKGGHLDASSPLNSTPGGTINGLCTPCHDPHGVSPTLNQDYAVPMLKGTWMTSPYKEDAAPSTTNQGRGGGDRVSQKNVASTPGYNIDQNTFTADTTSGKDNHTKWNFSASTKVSETVSEFGGLCMRCHPQTQIDPDNSGASAEAWLSYDRIHDSVKGWAKTSGGNANNTMHAYTCSKCHSPHNSALPRMLVTNCLQDDHRGQVASGGAGGSASGSGSKGAGRGRFPGSGGGYSEKNDAIFWSANTGGAWHFGNVGTNGTRQPAYRVCHDNQTGNSWTIQKWNNVSQW